MSDDNIKDYNQSYYLVNKEKMNEYRRAYYVANKEKCRANGKKHYQANKEKYIAKYKSRINTLKINGEYEKTIAEYSKTYYKKNRDEIIENGKMYYAKNKEEIKYKNRMNPKQSKMKNKQAIIDANLANLLVKKELFKQKLLDEAIV
jgi:hypothetical protein